MTFKPLTICGAALSCDVNAWKALPVTEAALSFSSFRKRSRTPIRRGPASAIRSEAKPSACCLAGK